MKKFIVMVILGGLLFWFIPAHAQLGQAAANLRAVGNKTGLVGESESSLGDIIGTIVKVALSLVGSIFLVLTIYAGILWMTASGKEEQIETAKKIVTAAVIGLFITMAAYAITYFVTNKLSNIGVESVSDSGFKGVDPNSGGSVKKCADFAPSDCLVEKNCAAPSRVILNTDCVIQNKSTVCCAY